MTRVVYGPPTLMQELSRVLRHYPYGIPIRPREPSCPVCGTVPAIRCCEFGADRA